MTLIGTAVAYTTKDFLHVDQRPRAVSTFYDDYYSMPKYSSYPVDTPVTLKFYYENELLCVQITLKDEPEIVFTTLTCNVDDIYEYITDIKADSITCNLMRLIL